MDLLKVLLDRLLKRLDKALPGDKDTSRVISEVSKVKTNSKSTPKFSIETSESLSNSTQLSVQKKYEVATPGKMDSKTIPHAVPNNPETKDRVDKLRRIIDTE